MRLSQIWIGLVFVLLAGGVALYLITLPSSLPTNMLEPRTADLANGETMYNIGGCFSCHGTPNQKDRSKLGGGLVLATPFGSFRAPNISSDPQHGIGAWSEYEFVNAMLKGVGRNDEHLFPAFPYTSYQRMRIDDVRDLYAYLKTLPAIAAPSRPHELSFPFNVRAGIGLWKLLYFDGKTFAADDDSKTEAYNRGAYLVEGPGHCAECHSPRNVLGGIKEERRFAGGLDAEGKHWVPNITPHEDGIAHYSLKDLTYLLETGVKPDFDVVGSTMGAVVDNTSRLAPADRAAIASYLKALPPRPGKAAPRDK
jgi:mono/diheme cytochrome c family protein